MITELSLRASYDLDLLAPSRVVNTVPPGTIPDCEACDDLCCAGVENVVSLRLSDVARLMDVGRTDLISKKKPRFPEQLLASRPALRELTESELFRTLPVLRQEGDARICAALGEDLKCTLYPAWPLSCERFPYSLLAQRRRVVWGTRCPSKKSADTHQARSRELFHGAVDTFNERIKDAILLAHARHELDELGIGAFLTQPGEDPFEAIPEPRRLPLLRG
ncbi:MAG: hypothetical protein HYZ27_04035 [Deltaproteobacteria bacterium]|nr:hypothetical protein [Deltaproteobacteria bacterium]